MRRSSDRALLFRPLNIDDHLYGSTYDACDVGTLQNQTLEGEPTASEGLSYQPGQKLSACTCKGEDHPGPNSGTGRGGPEIDVLEAQSAVVNGLRRGQVSQSAQIAPYGKVAFAALEKVKVSTIFIIIADDKYHWKQSSGATTIYDEDVTMFSESFKSPIDQLS